MGTSHGGNAWAGVTAYGGAVPRVSAPRRIARRVGARIRNLRAERGVTQETLAWDCDLSKTHLSQMEAGIRVPSVAVLFKLADRLGVEAVDLLAVDPDSPRTTILDAVRRKDAHALAEAVRKLGMDIS